MLNGVDPVVIFQFSRLAQALGDTVSKIPVVSDIPTLIEQPPIPIYLSEGVTGLMIMSEDKNVDIQTDTETLSDGSQPQISQKGIGSTLKINMECKKDSTAYSLLSAMIDQVFDKVTSQEYAITYLHGAITIFRGVLHSYAVSQVAGTDKMSISVELSKGTKTPQKQDTLPQTPRITGAVPIG